MIAISMAGVVVMAGLIRIAMAIEELANAIRAFPHINSKGEK